MSDKPVVQSCAITNQSQNKQSSLNFKDCLGLSGQVIGDLQSVSHKSGCIQHKATDQRSLGRKGAPNPGCWDFLHRASTEPDADKEKKITINTRSSSVSWIKRITISLLGQTLWRTLCVQIWLRSASLVAYSQKIDSPSVPTWLFQSSVKSLERDT